MQTTLNPYLNFTGNAREAMEFYHSVFGGNLTMQTYKEFGASRTTDDDGRIMHAQLTADSGLTLMAADGPSGMDIPVGSNVSLSISGDNDAEIRGYFEKLSAGGTVTMPLERAQWGDTFGMCSDQFGIHWLMNIAASAE